jgi:dolichyl-phosphate beta-glucosyltransferase
MKNPLPTDTVPFSLVLPAYNEALRLPSYLRLVREHLDGCYGNRYEVIVVDDGSQDGLSDLLERAAENWPQLRWIRHPQNQGKGAAVRTGVLASQGDLVLFADADGATPIEEQVQLAKAIRDGADVAVGSRLAPSPGIQRSRGQVRGLAGRVFATVARRLLGLSVWDTQCGFKMFRGETGRRLFSSARESGFLFDLEILALAGRLGCQIAEIPVRWSEVPGGHLSLPRELPRIMTGLFRLRKRLQRGPAST